MAMTKLRSALSSMLGILLKRLVSLVRKYGRPIKICKVYYSENYAIYREVSDSFFLHIIYNQFTKPEHFASS